MAVRLQMRLGVVAESDRLPDSPDRILVVEPSIGSVARSKGSLYLLVTCLGQGHRLSEATRLVAESIRDQYYYDESAGIRVCLVKAISSASKRLAHDRERYGVQVDEQGNGPVGVALAVVRANELYVATVGPAEAYLTRQGRLSTLPDPHRDRGLPSASIEAEVWRGELSVGDSLVLLSPNLVSRLGPEELRDVMMTLHPQTAMEHLHNRYLAADGTGSDGAIALEATEVAATQKQRALVPVRPPEPLAGAPERSPIPLADSLSDGVAAVQASAREARSAAGGAFERLLRRLQDLMPRRSVRHRRVTPISSRRASQRRAAIGIIGAAVVVALLGVAVYLGSGGTQEGTLSSLTAGQKALQQARDDLSQVFSAGLDLVADDPPKAEHLLTDAYQQLDIARSSGLPATTVDPLRQQTVAGLDRLYRVVDVSDSVVFTFAAASPPVDLGGFVLGPDGAPYVLDRTTKSVFRVDLKARRAVPIVRAGQAAGGTKVAEPRYLAVGGPDLLILDSKNALWRWRPADKTGKGTLTRVQVNGATTWGPGVKGIGTYLKNADQGLYNLYVVDPTERQILRYSPAADGSGFPAAASGYLATAQALDGVTSIYIDSDVYIADTGGIERYVAGRGGDWRTGDPGDTLLRPAPSYQLLAAAGKARQGLVYGWDRAAGRVIGLDKGTGAFHEQYRIPGDPAAWADVRGMAVTIPSGGGPVTLWWIDKQRLMSAALVAIPAPGASPAASGPSPSPIPSPGTVTEPSPGSSPRGTPRPSHRATPRPSVTP